MTLDQLETKGLLVDGFIQTVPSIEQKKLNLVETKLGNNSFIRKTGLGGVSFDKYLSIENMYSWMLS